MLFHEENNFPYGKKKTKLCGHRSEKNSWSIMEFLI